MQAILPVGNAAPVPPPSAPGLCAPSLSAASLRRQGWSHSGLTPSFLCPFLVFTLLHETIHLSHSTFLLFVCHPFFVSFTDMSV